jgi:hypothetical protein
VAAAAAAAAAAGAQGVVDEDEEENVISDHGTPLIDAEAVLAALSRGGAATTGFTLQLLGSARSGAGSGEEEEPLPEMKPVRLTLRQQCALALREMSRDPTSRLAIIAQGGFRALLQVKICNIKYFVARLMLCDANAGVGGIRGWRTC